MIDNTEPCQNLADIRFYPARIQTFTRDVRVHRNGLNGTCGGHINEGHATKIQNDGPVIVTTDTFTNMVTHVRSRPETQWTTEIEER